MNTIILKKSSIKLRLLAVATLILLTSLTCTGQEKNEDSESTAVWEPIPVVVTPGVENAPPSDAIVLLGDSDLNEWETTKGEEVKWKLEDGVMTVVERSGSIQTKKPFGSCQLHIEWRTPSVVKDDGQDRGNSGIFLQGRYEVQVLDSYENKTYVNGQAGSIYKQHIPLVNACRKPGEWQSYDIIYTAPIFNENETVKSPGYFTVIQNGVLIQNHVEVKGNTVHKGKPYYEKHNPKEPIVLQDHGCPVSYRNIWIREL